MVTHYTACLEEGDREATHVRFYRYIRSIRSKLPNEAWSHFLITMSGHVASSCRILRNEKVPELLGSPVHQSTEGSRASTPSTNESDGELPPYPLSPLAVPHHQSSADNPVTTKGSQGTAPSLQPLPDSTSAPDDPPTHRYTSVLKELADTHGTIIKYDKTQLSAYPSSWHCIGKFGDFVGEGIGSSYSKARHAASKQLCDKIGLAI